MDPLQVCEHAYKQQNHTLAEAFVCMCFAQFLKV